MFVELCRPNWDARYLSVKNRVYRIVPTDFPPGYAYKHLDGFRCFRLERITGKNALLDALAWLCENKNWANVFLRKTELRNLYFVCDASNDYFY